MFKPSKTVSPHSARRSTGGMAIMVAAIAAMLAVYLPPSKAHAFSDSEVIRGFNLTVFGAEFAPLGIQSHYIRKFNGTVRFRIHNLSKKNRTRQMQSFINSLNGSVRGLRTQVVNSSNANFNVYVVDREDYVRIAREKVYRRANAQVPGKCLVRSVFSRNGIVRSDAVVVSDGGESLFKRCMAEEILQGLGPLNEHSSLSQSMFNDRSNHTRVTRFDRLILNMLYDSRIRNGQSSSAVQSILPQVLRDAKRRVR